MFTILSAPPTKEEITEKYQAALQKQRRKENRRTVGEKILIGAPPLVDLCLLPFMIPLMIGEAVVNTQIDNLNSWLEDDNPQIYTFISEKDCNAYSFSGYKPCEKYIEAVKAQGRTLTAGELVSLQRYKWTVDKSTDVASTAASIGGDVIKNSLTNAADAATDYLKSGIGSFFRKPKS